MRISDQQLLYNQQVNLQRGQDLLTTATDRASSGVAVNKSSDNPVAYNQILSYDAQLTQLSGYAQNSSTVRTTMTATDGALQSVQGILANLRELAVEAQGAGTNTALVATQAQGLRDQLQQVLNQNVNGQYLFSGYSTSAPFVNNQFTGDNQLRAVQVSPLGATVFGVSAQQAFGATPGQVVFPGLDSMIAGMKSGNQAAIGAGLTAIDGYAQQVSQAQTAVGAQLNTLDLADKANAAYKVSINAALSGAQDVNPAEAYSVLSADQTAMQATYQVIATDRNMSLTKYL